MEYKGTTEQFVFHFNEQFRQLEEISDPSEHFPPQIKLQLLQNSVRPINDLRIVENLDEFQSITTGYGKSSSLKSKLTMIFSSIPVSDMTGQRRQTLPRGVTFTKHPSHPTMMVLMMSYHLRLQTIHGY